MQALVFGLSHISNARDAGEPVLATVAMTGVAGRVFGWLATHSGSLVAPALAHLAINEAGTVTRWWCRPGCLRRLVGGW